MGFKARPSNPAEIDWSALEHAYGPARDVPGWLRDIAGSDASARQRAVDALGNAVNHQGWPSEIVAALAPHLIALARDASGGDCAALLALLADLAAGGDTASFLAGAPHALDTPWVGAVRRALEADLPLWRDLLDSRSGRQRACAAVLVGALPDPAGASAAALRARLAGERGAGVAATLLISLGIHGRDDEALLQTCLDDDRALVRTGAAAALAVAEAPLPARAAHILLETASAPGKPDPTFAWHPGPISELTARLLERRGGADALLAFVDNTPSPGFGVDPAVSIALGRASRKLMQLVFPEPFAARPSPRDLTELQRRASELLARRFLWDDRIARDRGLPLDPEDVIDWLGIEVAVADTLLDEELAIGDRRLPLHAWWCAAAQSAADAALLIDALIATHGRDGAVDRYLLARSEPRTQVPGGAALGLDLLAAAGPSIRPRLERELARLEREGPPQARARAANGRWRTTVATPLFPEIAFAIVASAGASPPVAALDRLRRDFSQLPEHPWVREVVRGLAPDLATQLALHHSSTYYCAASTTDRVLEYVHDRVSKLSDDFAARHHQSILDFVAALERNGRSDEAAHLARCWTARRGGAVLELDPDTRRARIVAPPA